MEIIPFLHFFVSFLLSLYGFLTKKNWFDFYYLLYNYITVLSWTFYNGDCLITYYYIKQTNPNYKAGDFRENSDLHLVFGKKYVNLLKKYHSLLVGILFSLSVCSIYRVFIRNNFSIVSIFLMLSFYISYYISIMAKFNLHFWFFFPLFGCLLYLLKSWKSFVLI